MRENRPSVTAQRVAIRRAAHQLLDDPKVFDDPIALRIVGPESAAALQADPHQVEATPLSSYLRAFMAARSRIAEDEFALAVRRGVRQYVVLGAGLDTFSYRNPYPAGTLRVFEVDYPATQVWKRARLEQRPESRGRRFLIPRLSRGICGRWASASWKTWGRRRSMPGTSRIVRMAFELGAWRM